MTGARDNVFPFPGEQLSLFAPFQRCIKCGRSSPDVTFGRDKTKRNGLQSSCRDCEKLRLRASYLRKAEAQNAAQRADRRANPAKYQEIERRRRERRDPQKARQYQHTYLTSPHGRLKSRLASALRRARLRNAPGTFSVAEWLAQLVIQNHRCYYCKKRFNDARPATIDHLVAITRGGSNYANNIVAACGSCNSRKFAKRVVLL